ncbi:MBL fold metallo-hydrolase [Algoriphagus zhangzhouensis]|uniref:Glyoxylase, beta-lactamase superfamily II n=1 Tax=Algoriphagus zhangzhouensis TaxID=1073327 RepID=A0A1M7ZDF4_9BACT|nr:MBL fold metallo-hydrolase [Algoriphagus zhangzhouensis]TDY45790.1 glyoxylase-like metal-dependent hydrolase (beta-lactamase superfamily II) [Algoriphagus zhangzhouensis]SHO62903.1 Glyoxylase, beta-lactamase superfamily II [Algoriphagus zhangzhouensis]
MLKIKSFTFNPFQENTYVIYDDKGNAAIIDPGCYEKYEQQELHSFIEGEGLKPQLLLNTHCHVDHVLGNAWVKRTYGIPFLIHQNEVAVLNSVQVYAPNYGFALYEAIEPDGYLSEGHDIEIGSEELKVLFVPGHAPGHVVFHHEGTNTCIAGDTLFRGSIGRTDLPGGNHEQLLTKIKSELFSLPDQTVIYPGHGPETTIEFEKIHNPFVGKNASF